MDHRVDAVAGPQLPLDVVDNVVDLQQVLVGGHLRVEGHHGPARAIVVIDQVVDAQNFVVAQDDAVNVSGQLRVHGPAQQGGQGGLGGLPPGL